MILRLRLTHILLSLAIIIAISAATAAASKASPDVRQEAQSLPPAPAALPVVSISWVGDMTLGSRYGLPPDHGRRMLSAVAPALRASDITWGNLEGTFSTGGTSKCGASVANCYAFQAPPANAQALYEAGFEGINLANNHAHDFGEAGLSQTHAALSAHHVAYSGGRGQITYISRKGVRVAVIGFASYAWSSDITNMNVVRALVREADRHADLVVVFFHGGAEGSNQTHTPIGTEHAFGENRGNLREFAHAAVSAGADFVAGSGPHVMRGIERYKGRVISYSMGNFAGYHNFGTGGTLSLSGILTVSLRKDGQLLGGHLQSVILDSTPLPHLDGRRRSVAMIRSVSRQDFGSRALAMDSSGRF